jgi:hypothetical protein
VWVLVDNLNCVGIGMVRVGDIHDAGILVLIPGSWRIPWDGGRYSSEALPDVVDAIDVDALEWRVPSWRRY